MAKSKRLDRSLYQKNQTLKNNLFFHAFEFKNRGDLRWFFAHAHASITGLLLNKIQSFEAPNDLLTFNLHFGEAFIAALGVPPPHWRAAFLACGLLKVQSQMNLSLSPVVSTEECAAFMAFAHIQFDLRKALLDVGCISVIDYANMLPLVKKGAQLAFVEFRGQSVGNLEAILVQYTLPLEEKLRNMVYQDVCKATVPPPNPNFSARTSGP